MIIGLIFVIIHFLTIISAQRTIAIHFYESCKSSVTKFAINDCNFPHKYLDSVNESFVELGLDLQNTNLKVFIIDLDTFLLKFFNEEKILEKQQYNIYINEIIFNYQEFAYFYNIVMNFPYLIENINESKYRLIFRIMITLNIKDNKFFEEFIRVLLASLLFNTNAINKCSVVEIPNICSISGYISKKIIVELFKLYFFTEKTLQKLENISVAVKLTDDLNLNFLNLNENCLYLDSDILEDVLKTQKNSMNFFKILDIIFRIHTFNSVFFYKIFYEKKYNLFSGLSLFESLDEIYFFKCSNTDILIESIYEIRGSKPLKTINIIYSKFYVKDEVSWLETLNFEKLNYIAIKSESVSHLDNNSSDSLFGNIFSEYIEEISILEKSPDILYLHSDFSYSDEKATIDLKFYQQKSNLEKLRTLRSRLVSFNYIEISNSFITFDFYVLNFKEFKNLEVEFYNTDIKDFNSRESEIYNNVVHMRIICSKVSSVILSRILLLPSLKKLFFYLCIVTSSKGEVIFIENTKIENFFFMACSSDENNQHLSNFIIKMVALKSLKILCYSRNTNVFVDKFEATNTNFIDLSTLFYWITYYTDSLLTHFGKISNILKFHFGLNYPEGTLNVILSNNFFSGLQKLNLNKINIGREDKYALRKSTNLLRLYFSEGCKFDKISFSDLFDSNTKYLLTKIKLPQIDLKYCDLNFFANLKSLKHIYFYSFTVEMKIDHFFRAFSSVKEIELEHILISKNEIIEEFGGRLNRFYYRDNRNSR
ncbi:hypothetical protein CWI37_1074p0010 [Hamiltosporidium tvaerminnensis]|uniref:Uncharacterized protein n=1 Tax=Hamiltosporidium tvaerminnensis TaxID=1176355 RepID=A0A4Q9KYY4_9MICR|nr:hypothetical protein CWI37_1074p0010 [Hamiltosporidium tvaerminnensis]